MFVFIRELRSRMNQSDRSAIVLFGFFILFYFLCIVGDDAEHKLSPTACDTRKLRLRVYHIHISQEHDMRSMSCYDVCSAHVVP